MYRVYAGLISSGSTGGCLSALRFTQKLVILGRDLEGAIAIGCKSLAQHI